MGSRKQKMITMRCWQFWVDRGGTFTDCLGFSPDGQLKYVKVLSSDQAPLEGIRSILKLDKRDVISAAEIKMGTTIATNALLERKGEKHALFITKGFKDILKIGTQQRPDLFDIRIKLPSVLYKKVIEVEERVSSTGKILKSPDLRILKKHFQQLLHQGIKNIAIVLLHGYAYPRHEKIIAELARSNGIPHIACSHEVSPEIGLTARGDTTTADAYLTPLLIHYLDTLKSQLPNSRIKMMQSSGGLINADKFRGTNAILSGPAAGVVACARLGKWFGFPKIIGFDMGGTSTDVSRFDGEFEHVYETLTAGVRIKAPMIKIHTIAAGGGSICQFIAGRLTIRPESAGAEPGPLCYGLKDKSGKFKATDLTITDVNYFLGRLLQDNFPFRLYSRQINGRIKQIQRSCLKDGQKLSLYKIAEGFLEVINLKMAQAIKTISVAQGRDVREYVLCCFGGAAGQHACAVARHLGMKKILLHPLGGVLSAYGMGLADTTWEGSLPVARLPLTKTSLRKLQSHFQRLARKGRQLMKEQGFSNVHIHYVKKLDLRYKKTENTLTITEPCDGNYERDFVIKHHQLFGYVREKLVIEILQCRVEVIAMTDVPQPKKNSLRIKKHHPKSIKTTTVVFHGKPWQTPVYDRQHLTCGDHIQGPAIILEEIATIVLEPDFKASVDVYSNIFLEWTGKKTKVPAKKYTTKVDPIALEIFNNLFMSIAEQMGNILRSTSVSTNIKERLDFSCALFDQKGFLVANAPHIPVHLGAMGESVRAVMEAHPKMKPGDVFVTNNPFHGGTHLPDITVVTPVFIDRKKDHPTFFTASRAHHTDIGGSTPGSMPAFSKTIEEEGVLLDNVKLVNQGKFNENLFSKLFSSGEFPVRNLSDNLTDLQAQIAANHMGAKLLKELSYHYGIKIVWAYMKHVRDNASRQVSEALGRIPDGYYRFEDRMDDGTNINVRIRITGHKATIDFTGTSSEQDSNLNAPRAVVRSCILYVLRCLVAESIPLNDGCLESIEIVVPDKSLLNPSCGRAVVGGNVETSQRIVDVLFGALKVASASQGTMNNLAFGDKSFGYYETIAGGVGAAKDYSGASAVHTHMTNTRITDPEVLETQFPVQLLEFSIRKNSGGKGRFRGGDGIIRKYKFLKSLDVSILSQRRNNPPFGLAGGHPGKLGENIRRLDYGEELKLGGKASFQVKRGEVLIIRTPGGGGYGTYVRQI